MWLLLTLTVLLTREAVANFEVDNYVGDKSINRDIINIIARQVLTSDLKMRAVKKSYVQQTSPSKNENVDLNKEKKIAEAGVEERQKRSIDEIDLEKYMTKGLEKKKKPVSSWFYWPPKDDAITVEERSGDLKQEKKTPRFSPWGGKRIDSYLSNPEFRQTVHVFNSWGGKRDNEISKRLPPEDNGKLYSWNRLGPNDNLELKRVSKSDSERKIPFNSWGGKRWMDVVEFTPTILDDPPQVEGKIGFRNRRGQYGKSPEKLMRKMEERRMPLVQKFESWGGKRSLNEIEPENLNLSSEHFMETISSRIPKKRSNRALRHRSTFQPWGGKRSRETAPKNPNGTARMQPTSYFVRKVFFPWGG